MRWQEEKASPKGERSKRIFCETLFRLFDTGVDLQRGRSGGGLMRWQEEEASPKGEGSKRTCAKRPFASLVPEWNCKESA